MQLSLPSRLLQLLAFANQCFSQWKEYSYFHILTLMDNVLSKVKNLMCCWIAKHISLNTENEIKNIYCVIRMGRFWIIQKDFLFCFIFIQIITKHDGLGSCWLIKICLMYHQTMTHAVDNTSSHFNRICQDANNTVKHFRFFSKNKSFVKTDD